MCEFGAHRGVVPRISYFYGITIAMYWNERGHQVPHFHAEYAGDLASIALDEPSWQDRSRPVLIASFGSGRGCAVGSDQRQECCTMVASSGGAIWITGQRPDLHAAGKRLHGGV
jgi:hypothetical protein